MMNTVKRFELLKDGYLTGVGHVESQPFKPLVFTGGSISVININGELHISVDENTSVNLDNWSIEEVMSSFANGFLEDLIFGVTSKYKITFDDSIEHVAKDKLYILDKVVNNNTFVFKLVK